ncbi:MAG: Poly(A)+ RNA export protein [Amphiamblys sp. WSBS2006]|nr:MAG: Poly(A)+ RNA export protein [Amphiamblys sp. WSBS2006]
MSFGRDKGDAELEPALADTVSEISFSPTSDLFAAGSWDGKVRIWSVNAGGMATVQHTEEHGQPVMACRFSTDGTKIASGGSEKKPRIIDVTTGQSTSFSLGHEESIRCIRWVDPNIVACGSWDRTVGYWDMRTQNRVGALSLPERCYAMDLCGGLMVVGTAERHVCVVQLSDPMRVLQQRESPLKWQTRAVECFVEGDGYAISSIEGRVSIQPLESSKGKTTAFSFKCHRVGNDLYAVNALGINPKHGNVLATGGADGVIGIWDKESKQKIKTIPHLGAPVTAMAYNRTGDLLAYAVGYDWSKGYEHSTGTAPRITVHRCSSDELRARPGFGGRY